MSVLSKTVLDALLSAGFVCEPEMAKSLGAIEAWRVPGKDRYVDVYSTASVSFAGDQHQHPTAPYADLNWHVSDEYGWLCAGREIDSPDLAELILSMT